MGRDQAKAPEHEQQREQRNGHANANGQRMEYPRRLSLVLDQKKQRGTHAGDDSHGA